MTLLDWTYLSLWITSLSGALLFFGFTFRTLVKYPFAIVVSHVLLATLTLLLFTASLAQALLGVNAFTAHAVSTLSLSSGYAFFVFTYAVGVYFFLRFDAKRRRVRMQSIALHLSMAGLTFIFVTSAFAMVTLSSFRGQHAAIVGHNSPAWFVIHRQRELRIHSASLRSTPHT